MVVGAAANLKLHVVNYFRLDQATGRALDCAHRVADISWRCTQGMIGARLHAAELDSVLFANASRRTNAPAFTWRFSPDAFPCVAIASLADESLNEAETYGLFATERKARNALVRLAASHRLCHCLLGIRKAAIACPGCTLDSPSTSCGRSIGCKKELMLVHAALRPLRLPKWPHSGPVAIRERSDLHVVDQWQFLGTARSENELHALLESCPREFDKRIHRVLARTLSRLPRNKVIDLAAYRRPADREAATSADAQGW